MAAQLAEKAPYWKPSTISTARKLGRFMVVGCGDDGWNWGGLQFFGGNVGLAFAWASSTELGKPYSFIKASEGVKQQPVHALANILHSALREQGLLLLNHLRCAAFLGMRQIALTGLEHPMRMEHPGRTVAQERALAFEIAKKICPEMTIERFDETSEALGRVATKAVRASTTATKAMKPSKEHSMVESESGLLIPASHEGITQVALSRGDHEASLVAVTGDPTHRFDSMLAWGQGNMAYHVSLGHLPDIHQTIYPFMADPGYQNLHDVVAVFTAKTVLNLPLPGGSPHQTLGPANVQYLPQVQNISVGSFN